MFIKKFFYKIKQDILSLRKYPNCNLVENFRVDYEKYWNEKRKNSFNSILSSWQKQRADFILKMIKPGSTVLDLGCGDGAVLDYLKNNANIKGIGVDIDDKILEKARNLGIKTIKMNINELDKLDNLPEVDYILGLEIIEHLPNPEEFIFKIKKKAKKNLIFSFPNTGYYVHRLRLLFGRFPLQWVSHPGEHLRFWTVKDAKWWIKSMGLNLDKIVIYEGLPILNNFSPSLFGQGVIIKIKNKN